MAAFSLSRAAEDSFGRPLGRPTKIACVPPLESFCGAFDHCAVSGQLDVGWGLIRDWIKLLALTPWRAIERSGLRERNGGRGRPQALGFPGEVLEENAGLEI